MQNSQRLRSLLEARPFSPENAGCETPSSVAAILLRRLFLCGITLHCLSAQAQHQLSNVTNSQVVVTATASDAELAIKRFQVASGLKVDLWAAEPMLVNPVAFNFDERGRAFVCETFRLGAGVDDIRGIMDWLDEELACRSVDDRFAEMKRHLGGRFPSYSEHSERIRLLEDRKGTGKADHSTVFAEGFNSPLDGIGAGVLARKGSVWYANIPNLWLLRDTNGDGVADFRKSLQYGYGVRVGFLGHDLHGLHFGPDGKLYFSIGDRGSNVKTAEGRNVGNPESGCVFRCNPDGSDLEVFAYGLRNPQDLVFDDYGNLFTGDNNSDSGDQARWVYLVEGSDNGWRVGYQFMEAPYSRGPFNAEKLWHPSFEGQAPYIVPPIANIASGPSGVAYFPGTGLPAAFKGHFFLVDFRGGAGDSGIHSFTLKPKGAGFELVKPEHLVWGVLPTDVKFGVDGGIYFTDWIAGWGMPGKGRIYRLHDPALDRDPVISETKRLLADGLEDRHLKDLARLLEHPDMRIRQEAQFSIAERGTKGLTTLIRVASRNSHRLARLHAIWGLGQVISKFQQPITQTQLYPATSALETLLHDKDPEVRAQAAKVMGERRLPNGYEGLVELLQDESPRVKFFAAMSLGKLGQPAAVPSLLQMLRNNADRDAWLRHAGVMALTWIGDVKSLLAAAKDDSESVRIAALLTMRRLHREEIATFVHDKDPRVVLEAARAINDEPINGAISDLAALLPAAGTSEPLVRRVLNANFHLGTSESAKALVEFAARKDAAENMRAEALEELGDWPHPSGRDRVVGLWRPVTGARPVENATEALQPRLPEILGSAPDKVRVAAIRTVDRLSLTNAARILVELVSDTKIAVVVRVEALKALGALDTSKLEEALTIARKDSQEELRKAASLLEAVAGGSQAVARLGGTLVNGTTGEKQAALVALGSLAEPAADDVLAEWLDRLKAGQVPGELQLDLIEAATKRSSETVKQKLAAYQASKSKDDPLAEYRETLMGGHTRTGKKIFFDRPDAQCVRCHKIDGQGGDVGPDLSHIGSQKNREYLLESIVLPNKQIAQGFDSVLVTLKNDETYAGVLKSENADQVVINSPQTGLMTIRKADIQARQKALSPMPEGIGAILSKQDIRNLVEFLSKLK
jgi:quinoprotein glucose dehydrogenase